RERERDGACSLPEDPSILATTAVFYKPCYHQTPRETTNLAARFHGAQSISLASSLSLSLSISSNMWIESSDIWETRAYSLRGRGDRCGHDAVRHPSMHHQTVEVSQHPS
ncbi:hypothetical protein AAFF_G00155990, partial [Aldrovandia affinis]